MELSKLLILAGAVLCSSPAAEAQIYDDLDAAALRRSVAAAAADLPEVERRWLDSMRSVAGGERSFRELFGYNPPGTALSLASLHAFLYWTEGQEQDAQRAATYLKRMADYRERVPAELAQGRVEYAGGLPAVPSFFHLADYAEAWTRIRDCPALTPALRATIEAAIAGSADFIFVFPEWGPHNRALLRAECLVHAARALPDHPRAAQWRKLAEILAADSIGQWEIEDAQIYQPVWLWALLRYAEAVGDEEIPRSLEVRYYLRYFLELLCPRGTVPAFGDAWWNGGLEGYYLCFEWGATVLQDPELKWAAEQVYQALGPVDRERPRLGHALLYARAVPHVDRDLVAREPALQSGPVLEDVIGKKIVLRRGRGEDSLYLLLNYRDEGDWGVLHRDFLRQTLAVEEEKMHHGNADENAVVMFMDAGALLLHDGGYRERAPSGPFGAFRADLFHDRLVARRGQVTADQDLLEFLRDSGAYRKVRTEKIDFVSFEEADYSRTQVRDDSLGYVWERTLVLPAAVRAVVVVDTVQVLRSDHYTFATLWATQEVVATGKGWARGRRASIDGQSLPLTRDLLLVFPDRPGEVPGGFALRRHRQPEHVIHQTTSRWFEAGEHLTHTSVLWPLPPSEDPAAIAGHVRRLAATPEGDVVALEITTETGSIQIALKADRGLGLSVADVRPRYDRTAGTFRFQDVSTDADFVLFRRQAHAWDWCATNMTHVTLEGEALFEAQPFQVFQTSGRSDVAAPAKWRRWEGTTRR